MWCLINHNSTKSHIPITRNNILLRAVVTNVPPKYLDCVQFLCDESIVVDSHKLVLQLRPHLASRISWLPDPAVEMISWEKKFLISSSR